MKKQGIQKIEDFVHLAKADVHIHTLYSDGAPSVADLLEYVEAKTDLDVIAITDHDTIRGALEAQKLMKDNKLLRGRADGVFLPDKFVSMGFHPRGKPTGYSTPGNKYRFELIVGEEISSLEGHILGLFLKNEIPGGLPAHKVLKEIRAQGGVAIASHPFEQTRFKNPKMVTMDGVGSATLIKYRHDFDGIEVVNATPTLDDENLRASALNETILGLAETGSSDAHIVEAIGRGYTLFEGKTAMDLKQAILSRQTQAMHSSWSLLSLLKYFFFFVPKGFRLAVNTLLHGRVPKRTDIF